jgi:hypothetical protein
LKRRLARKSCGKTRNPGHSLVALRALASQPRDKVKELAMSRCRSILLAILVCTLLSAAPGLAQIQLQGHSQYGGLIRNATSQKCIDVFGSSTSKNANVQQCACNGGGNQRWEFIGRMGSSPFGT